MTANENKQNTNQELLTSWKNKPFFDNLSNSLKNVRLSELEDTFQKLKTPLDLSDRKYDPPRKVSWNEDGVMVSKEDSTLKLFNNSDASSIKCYNTILAETPQKVLNEWESMGLELLGKGSVAIFILAGGQGTRLGYDKPKGTYPIGFHSKTSLFEIFAQRVLRLRHITAKRQNVPMRDVSIPFMVMTSEATHNDTIQFFEYNQYFGLPKDSVNFIEQPTVPCFDLEGYLILQSEGKLAMNPNGNGGIFQAMKDSGAFDYLKSKNVEYVHTFSVDNVLSKVADPILLGFAKNVDATIVNKCTSKLNPAEKVGVAVTCHDMKTGETYPTVVEYSELNETLANEKKEDGSFLYGSANICNHLFKLSFMIEIAEKRYLEINSDCVHAAYKKIPSITGDVDGIKMEHFIFDSFRFSKDVWILECERQLEFAAIKNKSGNDSPESAQLQMHLLAKMWLSDAGAILNIDEEKKDLLELSPLLSYNGENLDLYNGKIIEKGQYISPFTDLIARENIQIEKKD